MKKVYMLCLGPKKSLSSQMLELTTQGMAQHTNAGTTVYNVDFAKRADYLGANGTVQSHKNIHCTVITLPTLK